MSDWIQSEACAADNFPTGIRTRGASAGRGEIVRCGLAVSIYVRQMRYRQETIRSRRYWLERFTVETGNMALKAIKPKTVTDWTAHHRFGPATERAALSHLRQFFRWCIEHGHLKADPMVLIRPPKQPRAVPRCLALDELVQLGDALPNARAVLVVTFMLDMGLRRAEVAGLDMADIDMRSGVVRVTGKGGHQRLLPLTPTARLMMTKYLAERGASGGPLIRSQTRPGQGIQPATLGKLVSQWMRDAGFKMPKDGKSGHSLRHSFATNLDRHGAPLSVIKDALGHAEESTTWRYIKAEHSLPELAAHMGQQFIEERRPRLAPVAEFETPRILLERDTA
jgi:site-specific recombinase XerD